MFTWEAVQWEIKGCVTPSDSFFLTSVEQIQECVCMAPGNGLYSFLPFHPAPTLLLCTFFENLPTLSGQREHFRPAFHLRESRVSLCMDVRCLRWPMTLTFAAHFKTLAFLQSPLFPPHSHFLAHCSLFSAVSTSHTNKTHQQL